MEIQTLQGSGYECNSYLIKDIIWLLVDVGTGKNAEGLAKTISKEGGLGKVKKILMTHTHFDHAGGAAKMKELTQAELLVHPLEGNRISSGDMTVARACFFNETIRKFEWSPMDEGDVIDTGTAKFKILHLPGHSEGSIGLWEEESQSLISGDTVFSDGGIGRYDLPSGCLSELKESIERLDALGARNLYPGHGRTVLGRGSEHISMSLEMVRGGML
jgi:hydroxyacylglutathione hydrolase